MKVIYAAAFYLLLFVVVEVVTRTYKLNKELSRKFIHVFAGITIAFLPLIMSFDQIAILGALFIPVLLISKRQNLFSSIHHVKRQTYGEVYFPVAIVLLALLFQQRYTFMYGMLIMALCDGFASIIGQKFGKKKLSIFGSKKSYAGSLTFLLIGVVVGILVLNNYTDLSIIQISLISIVCSFILTAVEACLSFGLDNLVIPIVAASLIDLSTKVVK